MRSFGLEPQARCALVMVGVLTLSLFEVIGTGSVGEVLSGTWRKEFWMKKSQSGYPYGWFHVFPFWDPVYFQNSVSFWKCNYCTFPYTWTYFRDFFQVMPLFCVALFIPVMGSISAVFGEARTLMTTSTLLLGSFFNQTSFLVRIWSLFFVVFC